MKVGVGVSVGGGCVLVGVGVLVGVLGVFDGVGVSVTGGGKNAVGLMIARAINKMITINPALTPPILRIVKLLTWLVSSGGESSGDSFMSSMISCTCSAVNPLTICVPITDPVTRISFSSPKLVPPDCMICSESPIGLISSCPEATAALIRWRSSGLASPRLNLSSAEYNVLSIISGTDSTYLNEIPLSHDQA